MISPGPVFRVELLTTSRRGRYFAARSALGLFLLFFAWTAYAPFGAVSAASADEMSIQRRALLARRVYESVATGLLSGVLAVTPAIVAPALAQDRERGNLKELLATPLSPVAIVLGKLLARLLHVWAFVLVGLPVLSLLGLQGGVDPAEAGRLFGMLGAVAFFLGGLSCLASLASSRVRDALMGAYVLELGWLVGPAVVLSVLSRDLPALTGTLGPAAGWVAASNPFAYISAPPTSNVTGVPSQAERFGPMVARLLAGGAVACLLTVALLRPTCDRERAGPSLLVRLARPPRLWPRPPCGERPLEWKEWHVGRPRGWLGVLVWMGMVLAGLAIGWMAVVRALPAWDEFRRYGYGRVGFFDARGEFNRFLATTLALADALLLVAVAGAAAAGVTGERERDTWDALRLTDLTGAEIVRAKLLGALRGVTPLAAGLAALVGLGLVVGGLHPIAAVLVAIELATFTLFAASLGTVVSLWARTTLRSVVLTVAILAALNGGYLMCCVPMGANTALILTGVTPFVVAYSSMAFGQPDGPPFGEGELAAACVLSWLLYASAAFALTITAVGQYDHGDRPADEPSPG